MCIRDRLLGVGEKCALEVSNSGSADKRYSLGSHVFLSMNLYDRLREWREVVATLPTEEDPEVLGGREAEQFLTNLVEAHRNFKGATVYPNKRVPSGTRRREIDLIIITAKRIHVIEVKNWSGELCVRGCNWIQTNRNNQEIEHPDLVADHQEKNDVLLKYLRREGVSLEAKLQTKYIANKVIFMNRRLIVRDRSIYDHPDVLLPHRLDAYLNSQRRSGLGNRILGSVVQWCLDTDSADVVMDGYLNSLSPDKIKMIENAIDRLSTWDTLVYHGSRVETGDLIRASIGGKTFQRDQFGSRRSSPVRWTRHKTWGLIKSIAQLSPLGTIHLPEGPLPLSSRDFVFFHRAGDRTPTEIPLVELNAVTTG